MRSEQQHIDDFFRKKEEDYQPDTGALDGDWEHMRGLLKPAGSPIPKGYRLTSTRRIIKYLGGFTVVTVITLVWLAAPRMAEKQPTGKTTSPQTAAVPATKQPAAGKSVVSQPVAGATGTSTVKTAGEKAATPPAKTKPVYRRTYSRTVAPALTSVQDQTPATITSKAPPSGTQSDLAADAARPPATEQRILPEAKKPSATDAGDAANQMEAFYRSLRKPAQEFTVNGNRDTVLIGQEGTRITIPARTFATRKKGMAVGNVQIVLREYYTYDDILAAKLTTTFGNLQLESGGMVNIMATADGEQAGIIKGKEIKLEMPTSNYDEEMQLFSGVRTSVKPSFEAKFMDNRMIDTVHMLKRQMDENGVIDWVPQGQQQRLFSNHDYVKKIKVLRLFADPYKIEHGKKTVAYFYIAPESPFSKGEMKTRLLEHANGYYDKVQLTPAGRQRNFPFFWIKREPGEAVADSIDMSFKEALRRQLLSPEDSMRIAEQIRKDSIDNAKRAGLMKHYSFTISNMGWFNCDRFAKERGPKVLFTFNPGEGFDAASMVSYLAFERFKSVLPGNYADGKIHFGNIPKDEPVKLISLGIKDGRVMACIQSLTVNGREIGNLAFEETTPEQFRQKIKSMNLSLP